MTGYDEGNEASTLSSTTLGGREGTYNKESGRKRLDLVEQDVYGVAAVSFGGSPAA
jgi:hypothetical protein